MKGPYNWAAVRDATASHDVKGALFYIPPNCAPGQLLRLMEFNLEVAVPYVYDRFIISLGMFPHHDQVPL